MVGYESVPEFLAEHRGSFDFLAPEDVEVAKSHMAEVIRTGEVGRFEYRVRRRDGVRVPVEASVGLIRGRDGEPRGLISISRDLTERKEAERERRRLEAQLQHAQKLESMGILAGGIAHDFNNLLVGVLGNASLAKQEVPVGSVTWDRIHQIGVAAQRAAGLTREMLAYSGRGKFVIEPLDLSILVGEISRLLEVSISKKIEVTFEFADGLPAVRGDASQLQQVIMNLITNASEAIGDRDGSIRVATRLVEVAANELTDSGSAEPVAPGKYVCLCVRDSGCGMDTETLRDIFDPFFTTKFTGRGLGLAAVLGIVRGHDGAIVVESEVGRGSNIRVLLPCAPEMPVGISRRLTPTPHSSQQWHGSGLVLVVDDEDLVREVATLALERVGFTVLSAGDGEEGVRLFSDHADEVVAVVLDLTMPRMDGREALERMRELREHVPVVITSGFSEEEASARFDDDTTTFVQKPFSPVELVGALRSRLEP
jgi:signal transduction histidine kinase/CheY-like chemotaxis protein